MVLTIFILEFYDYYFLSFIQSLFSREPRLYKRVCPSVGPSVGPLVRNLFFLAGRNEDGEQLILCIQTCLFSAVCLNQIYNCTLLLSFSTCLLACFFACLLACLLLSQDAQLSIEGPLLTLFSRLATCIDITMVV